MIAFPIPSSEPLNPIILVLVALAATAGFVAIVFQAVRYFRNNGNRTDVFGPATPDDRRDDRRDDTPDKRDDPA